MNSAIANKNRAAAVTARVKRLVVRRGGDNGIRALSRSFGIAKDTGGSATVSRDAFVAALKEHDVVLSPDDVNAVWAAYDISGTGSIDPVDFIASLRCGLGAFRRTLLERVWESFTSKTPHGCVDVRHLHRAYQAGQHPEVVRGERREADVKRELLDAFSDTTNPDGSVSRSEFFQYYAAVSARIEEDETFAALLRGCWSLPGTDAYFTATLALTSTTKERSFAALQPLAVKATIAEQMQMREELSAVIAVHRTTLLQSRLGFRGLGRLLRSKDVHGTGYLSQEDFLDALWNNRLYVENKRLLAILDTNNDNTIDSLYYVNLLIPEYPPVRLVMLERLWARFATDAMHCADISEIHKRYKAKDGAALNIFLDGWDKRHAATARGGRVGFCELLEWYAPLSASTQMDHVFQQVLISEWA